MSFGRTVLLTPILPVTVHSVSVDPQSTVGPELFLFSVGGTAVISDWTSVKVPIRYSDLWLWSVLVTHGLYPVLCVLAQSRIRLVLVAGLEFPVVWWGRTD